MKTSRSATAAGSRTTVYLPGSIADGILRRAPPCRSPAVGERRRLEQPQLVERLRRPARPRSIRRARRQVVVGGGEPVVGEEALASSPLPASPTASRRTLPTRRPSSCSARWPSPTEVRASPARHSRHRRSSRSRASRSAARANGIASGILRRDLGDLLGILQRPLQARIVELRGRDRPRTLAEAEVIARLVPDDAPEVVAVFRAKRRLARSLPLTATNGLLPLC